jgi:hypothetical protein
MNRHSLGTGRATADMLTSAGAGGGGGGGSTGRYSGGFSNTRPSKIIKIVIDSSHTFTINVPDRIPINTQHNNDDEASPIGGGNKSQSWIS